MVEVENSLTHLVYDNSPVWLQNIFVSVEGLQSYRLRYNGTFACAVEFLERSSKFSWAEMEEYQGERLRSLIRHAYETVPYYHELFSALRLRPEDIKTPEHLKLLPIITKETVVINKPKMLSTAVPRKELVPVHTSGTTGTALQFWWTREGTAWEFAFVWARRRAGVSLGEPFATFNGRSVVPIGQSSPPFWRYNAILRQTLFSIYHMNERTLDSYIMRLRQGDFRYYVGYPSAIYTVASYALEHNLKLVSPPIKVFTSSESLTDWQRNTIECAFETKVDDSYTNGEQSVLLTQCDHGNYHVNYEYSVVEFEPMEENQETITAKVIGTGFLNYGMPFIRYDTGDCVEISKIEKSCPCGRFGPIIKKIHGRQEDLVITPEGNIVGRLDHIFKDMIFIKESQIIQHEDGSLEVLVVPREKYSPQVEEQLLHEFRRRLGNTIYIKIKHVDSIPRGASGKFRAVISHYRPPRRWLRTAHQEK